MPAQAAVETPDGVQLIDVTLPDSYAGPNDTPRMRRRRRARADMDAAQDAGELSPVESIARRSVKRLEWSEEDQLVMVMGLSSLLGALSALTASRVHVVEARMADYEANAIAQPTTRILLRHVHVKAAARGDIADAVALVTAVSAYGARVWTAQAEKAEAEHAE